MSGSSKGGVSVIISATDRATLIIDKLNKKLQAMQRPMAQLSRAVTRFQELSGLRSLEKGFQAVASAGLRVFSVIGAILAPIAALTGAFTIAGVSRLVKEFAAFSDELLFTSYRLGVVPQQLQALQGAAMLSGASAAGLTAGIETLKTTLTNAVGGFAPDAVLMGRTLGIALTDGRQHALDFATVMPKLIDRIKAINDPILRMRAATAFFGSAASDMMPIIMAGSAAWLRQIEIAKKYGTETDADIAKGRAFNESFSALSISVRSLTNNIGAALAPSLTELSWWMANLILANKEWIRTSIDDKVKQLRDYIASPQWTTTKDNFWSWADATKRLVGYLGGLQNVLIGLVAIRAAVWFLNLNPLVMGLVAAVTALTAAYYLNSSAYEDWQNRTNAQNQIDAERKALQDRVSKLSPAQRAEFDRLQAKHGGTLMAPGYTDIDRQRRGAGLPTRIGGFASDPNISPQARGWLDSIARVEADKNGYASANPNSSARGRYQFMPDTLRDEAARGFRGMDPATQDAMAWDLGQRRYHEQTGRNLADDVKSKDPAILRLTGSGVNKTWPSMEGGSQRSPKAPDFLANLRENIDRQVNMPVAANSNVNVAGGTGASAGAATIRGSADLNVNFRNAPPGTQVATSTEGDLFSGVKYNTPMPAFGP